MTAPANRYADLDAAILAEIERSQPVKFAALRAQLEPMLNHLTRPGQEAMRLLDGRLQNLRERGVIKSTGNGWMKA
jgi:hypothetical protein